MSKLQLLNVFVTERLSAAAVEIFGAVEKTIAEYQEEICRSAEENERLRRLLDMVIKPEIKLHRAGRSGSVFVIIGSDNRSSGSHQYNPKEGL
ncbi:unnamed protein product [Coregonus sp. 'balchen']|nr:unnamed protein product [Coregonus sp. 'balchen']